MGTANSPIQVINIKSGTIDYVGKGNTHAKFGICGITGGFFAYG